MKLSRYVSLNTFQDSRAWSRRAFLQGMGAATAIGAWNRFAVSQKIDRTFSGFAYVSSIVTSKVHLFEVRENHWTLRQTIQSNAPSSLAIHPSRQFLYVANEIDEYHGLPRGTVESYKIHANSGQLNLLHRQPLSLSGTRPRHLAITPDGRFLLVAVYGGGAYNILPVSRDGEIGRAVGILKEVGSGLHPEHQKSAHPHTIILDETGKYVVSSDQGCDRLNVFILEDGKLIRTHSAEAAGGMGPGHMVMRGPSLFISNAADGSIFSYRLDKSSGRLAAGVRQASSLVGTGGGWSNRPLILSHDGNVLYAAHSEGISVWKTDLETGVLSHIQTYDRGLSFIALHPMASGQGLIALNDRHNSIVYLDTDAESGKLQDASLVAEVEKPSGLALIVK
jgi:6-phosphogluconolactonase